MTHELPLLARHAGADPAACGQDDTRTADELLRDSAAIAESLADADPSREILVLCADRYVFVACLLAAWQRGLAVALPPNTQPGTIRELMHGAGISTLLHDGLAERGTDVRPILARGGVGRPDEIRALLRLPADRRIATVYTSGSTGLQRGYDKTAAQLIGEAESLTRVFSLGPGDRILATVPAQHIYGLLVGVLVPLVSGAAFVTGTPLYPEEVADRVRASATTVLASVPAHLRGLTSLAAGELRGVKKVLSSGAPLDRETATKLLPVGCEVFEIFGSSETGGIAWRETAHEERWHPMPGLRVGADAEGRLLLDSSFLDPLWPQPYVGSDCIELAEDGTFLHLGRVDGVVKVGGKRILIAELEQRLRGIDGVLDVAATAVPASGGRGSEIWCAVVAKTLTREAIRKALLQWFDPVTLPRRIRIVEALPREATGKLTKERLLRLFDGVSEFEVQSRSRVVEEGAERCDITLKVPPELVYFRGHFDGFPILAGVVILNELVLAECRRAWPELRHPRELVRVKFQRPIRPDDVVTVRLKRAAGQASVSFEAFAQEQSCNSGTLLFEVRA